MFSKSKQYQPTYKTRFIRGVVDVAIIAALFLAGTLAILPHVSRKATSIATRNLDQAAGELMVTVPIPQQAPRGGSPAQSASSQPIQAYEVRVLVTPRVDSTYPDSYFESIERQSRLDRSRSDAIAAARERFPDLTAEQLNYFFGPQGPVIASDEPKKSEKGRSEDVERMWSSNLYYSVNGGSDWFHSSDTKSN